MRNSTSTKAGTARLPIIFVAGLAACLMQSSLAYSLPIFFDAKGFPKSSYETWAYHTIMAWLVGCPLAGFLGGRIGDRRVWSLGLMASTMVIIWLLVMPSGHAAISVTAAATVFGISDAFGWIGAISLAQEVTAARKGLSNTLMITSLGVGSVGGPLFGHALVNLSSRGHNPIAGDFSVLLISISVISGIAAVVILLWGQHSESSGSRSAKTSTVRKQATYKENIALLRNAHYVALVIPLSLLGGAVFQATNVYLPYRARDPWIALIIGPTDHGWAALMATGAIMGLLGGILIGRIAGRKASMIAAAGILGAFATFGLGIGLSPNSTALFVFVAGFEVMRSFMRWLQTGYVSEHFPDNQRTAAIGVSTMLSGLGGCAFNSVIRKMQSPESQTFSSSMPFMVAASLGFLGSVALVALYLLHFRRQEQAGVIDILSDGALPTASDGASNC